MVPWKCLGWSHQSPIVHVANTTKVYKCLRQDVRDYYWIDGSDTSYMEADVGAYWSDGEMAYLNPAESFSMHNDDEHCASKAPKQTFRLWVLGPVLVYLWSRWT